MKQSYVLLAVVFVVALINFFGAFFTIRKTSQSRRFAHQQKTASSSKHSNVFEEAFFANAFIRSFLSQIVNRMLSLSGFRNDHSRHD
jgi:hypothetical protein